MRLQKVIRFMHDALKSLQYLFTYGDVKFLSDFSVHSVSRVQQRDRPEGLPGNHHVRSGYHVHTF